MKKALFVVLLLTSLVLSLAVPVFAGPVMERIIKNGELVVGTTAQMPPMIATTKDGRIIGLDADIAAAMAASMGVKLRFVTLPFVKLLPSLAQGKLDMVMSGMTITGERNQKVAFVGPYLVSGKGILAMAEKYTALKEAEGLDNPEVTVAALKGSTSQRFAETLIPKAKLILTGSYDEAIDLIFAAKADVMIADYPFCALTAYRNPGKGLMAGESPLTFEPLGIAMNEDALLINWVQNFIVWLKGSGQLKEIQKRWLSGGEWVKELP